MLIVTKLAGLKTKKAALALSALLLFTSIGSTDIVLARSPEQREDVYKNSSFHDTTAIACSSSIITAARTDSSDSNQRIGYVSNLEGPYILEQFAIHSLKALALAKNVPETDTLTEEHVIALVAFSMGEGGDIANRNIFNPLNHGKISDDNGILTGDGASGFVSYPTFDDGVDANARVLNGSMQQRVVTSLTNPSITAEQFMESLSYWSEFPGDHYWAEASSDGIRGSSKKSSVNLTADEYYKGRVSLVNQVRSNWEGTAGLIVGTEAEEQSTGAKMPSKLVYLPVGSTTGAEDTPAGTASGSVGSDTCSAVTDLEAGKPEINMSKKDTFNLAIDGSPRPTITPTGVVLHWTGASANNTVDEFINGIKGNNACGEGGCSVQFYVAGDGTIYQLVDPINTLTAHAAGANSCCIGIEIGGTGPDDLLSNVPQKQAVINLSAYLVSTFSMQVNPDVPGLKGILSHHVIPRDPSAGAKTDVGDQYWLEVIDAVQKSSVSISGLNEEQKGWLKAAGIPESDWENVDKIVRPESGWIPTVQNSNSTAYGLGQFLDDTWSSVGCTKTDDPVEQLRCTDLYVKQRYTNWAGAVEYREKNGTY